MDISLRLNHSQTVQQVNLHQMANNCKEQSVRSMHVVNCEADIHSKISQLKIDVHVPLANLVGFSSAIGEPQ